jgi:uncharacterized protein
MKFLILLVAVVVLVGMLSASLRRLRGPKKPPNPSPAPPPASGVQAMLGCAHCGVHMPSQDMVFDGDRAYCSAAHRDAGPPRAAP